MRARKSRPAGNRGSKTQTTPIKAKLKSACHCIKGNLPPLPGFPLAFLFEEPQTVPFAEELQGKLLGIQILPTTARNLNPDWLEKTDGGKVLPRQRKEGTLPVDPHKKERPPQTTCGLIWFAPSSFRKSEGICSSRVTLIGDVNEPSQRKQIKPLHSSHPSSVGIERETKPKHPKLSIFGAPNLRTHPKSTLKIPPQRVEVALG